MLSVETKDGQVSITKIEGAENRLISDIGAIAHKTMLLIANDNAKSAEEVYLKYGILARELVDYIEVTVHRVNELKK